MFKCGNEVLLKNLQSHPSPDKKKRAIATFKSEVGWFVSCRFESNCLLVRHGTIGGASSMGTFLRDLNSYLHEFRRKARKTPNS